jgi:hypothetical protein
VWLGIFSSKEQAADHKPSFYEQVTDVKLLFLLSFIGLLLLLLVRLRGMLFSTEFLFALC